MLNNLPSLAYISYTLEDLKWDKVPLNPMATLRINELKCITTFGGSADLNLHHVNNYNNKYFVIINSIDKDKNNNFETFVSLLFAFT